MSTPRKSVRARITPNEVRIVQQLTNIYKLASSMRDALVNIRVEARPWLDVDDLTILHKASEVMTRLELKTGVREIVQLVNE